jgi:uncharacterized membrane protein
MTIFKILLVIHILGGFASLLVGGYVMVAKKGDKMHKKIGKVYFWAMLIAALVAIPMSFIRPNYFLFLISIFTLYMLLTGVRYLHKKKLEDVNLIDWGLMLTMLSFGLAFIIFGVLNILKNNYFGSVFIVFGGISLLFSYQDFRNFKGNSQFKNYFLIVHLQRMTGAYVASLTAFLVVNNTFLPSIVAWLLPTFALTPLLIFWTKKYKISK